MSPGPTALLIDDGELDDVDLLLGELTDRVRLRGDESPDPWPWPSRLLVATPERVLSLDPPAPGCAHTTIVVAEGDSKLLHGREQPIGFDYVVRRPVHPEALRLLFLRALFSGSEQRGEPRLPLGYRITWISGCRLARATLLDISLRGCRLQAVRQPSPGSGITLHLPRDLVGGLGLVLRGEVVRGGPQDYSPSPGTPVFGVSFQPLKERPRHSLSQLLSELALGPAVFREDSASEASIDDGANDAVTTVADPADPVSQGPPVAAPLHRLHRRGAFRREVTALDERAERVLHVLVGRDLSAGGLLVERHPALAVGSELRLAIYGDSASDPLVVKAQVVRDYGDRGFGVRFEGVDPARAQELETIVRSVPAIEAVLAGDGDPESAGVLVAEILSSLPEVSVTSRIHAVKEPVDAPRLDEGTLESDVWVLAAAGCTVQHIFDVIRESPTEIVRALESLLENHQIRIED